MPVSADVAVNNLEKNDKIITNGLTLQMLADDQTVKIGTAADLHANNTSRVWELHAEQWELTRSGETVLSLPVLNQLINSWLQEKDRQIEVRYPGGEEGEFWVQELTDWLVSLGIPSNHIVTIPGSGADDMIKFALIK
ncbi:MAG: hypothetical protein LJE83_04730 [Gammaproteobacteria bacterium]|nr:hypothetical protein [Gammaproteobacteria bacterium]